MPCLRRRPRFAWATAIVLFFGATGGLMATLFRDSRPTSATWCVPELEPHSWSAMRSKAYAGSGTLRAHWTWQPWSNMSLFGVACRMSTSKIMSMITSSGSGPLVNSILQDRRTGPSSMASAMSREQTSFAGRNPLLTANSSSSLLYSIAIGQASGSYAIT
jgi:hypothetical protein